MVMANIAITNCIFLWTLTMNKDFIKFVDDGRPYHCKSLTGRLGGDQKIALARQCAEERILIHQVSFAMITQHNINMV